MPRVFKILSIDGGGIKGLYSAAMLAQLERALQERHRASGATAEVPKLNHCFDLIAGTSTGAIIASGLACGKSAAEILTLYRTLGPAIFPDRRWFPRLGRWTRQMFLGARYSHKPLSLSLHAFLDGRRFSSAENYLVIPVTNMRNYTPRIFKTRHSEKNQDHNDLLASIAVASASAPTYFPLCPAPDVPNGLYADGGLYANNPTLVALIEAFRVFVGPSSLRNEFDEVWVLSLGNYGSPQGFRTGWFGFSDEVSLNKSVLGWMTPQRGNMPILSVLMDAQASSVRFSVEILHRCMPAFRHYCRSDGQVGKARATPVTELTSFVLADARAATLARLEGYGAQDGQTDATDPNVLKFFDAVCSPVKFYYPPDLPKS